MERFVVVSGCSGGGKSTLIAELRRRGQAVVQEPGRRIVASELARGGTDLPWIDPAAFARRAIAMALEDFSAAHSQAGWVFFDRGLIDAAVALRHVSGDPAIDQLAAAHRFHRRVFMAPPWREIRTEDEQRRHGWEEAVAEHERLLQTYPALGYTVVMLPRMDVDRRADFVLATLG
jgi:predicted ATPase